jgi:hypothetical protein
MRDVAGHGDRAGGRKKTGKISLNRRLAPVGLEGIKDQRGGGEASARTALRKTVSRRLGLAWHTPDRIFLFYSNCID